MPTPAKWFSLTNQEKRALQEVIKLAHGYKTDLSILDVAIIGHRLAHELPARLRNALADFKASRDFPAIIIRGLPQDESTKTPSSIPSNNNQRPPSDDEIIHIAIGSLIGQAFAWNSIQDGNIVNHVIPEYNNRKKLISSGYELLFDFHTEDAFHPLAGDYLALSCIRNPSETPTLLAFIGDINTKEDWAQILFEKKFLIGANIAHNVLWSQTPTSILYGCADTPYVRFNKNNMNVVGDAQAPLEALEKFSKAIEDQITEVKLESGDAIYIDNFRTIHARPPYTPHFTGDDRWLKRLYISSLWRDAKYMKCASGSLTLEGTNYDPN